MTHMRNHNFLAAMAADIRDLQARALEQQSNVLETFRDIGEKLNDAKESIIGVGSEKGAFGKWCDDNGFGFSKPWRSRLMKLAENWKEILQAIQETKDADAFGVGTVQGALGCWAAWKKEHDPQAAAKATERERRKAERKAAKATEKAAANDDGKLDDEATSDAEELRRALEEALKRIKSLEEELARSKEQAARQEPPKAKPQPYRERKIDFPTMARAKKIWRTYAHPTTPDGEKAAARSHLERFAHNFSMSFEQFCAECGIAA